MDKQSRTRNIQEIRRIDILGLKWTVIVDADMPKNEIHLLDDQLRCVGKIVNIDIESEKGKQDD